MSIYYQTLKTLNEVQLPPAHQSWREFNRDFFDNHEDEYDGLNEFVSEYLDWHSGVLSFLADEDNFTVKSSLDSYGPKFIAELQNCTTLDLSIIVELLAPLLYD
jgi:hypothetical protein